MSASSTRWARVSALSSSVDDQAVFPARLTASSARVARPGAAAGGPLAWARRWRTGRRRTELSRAATSALRSSMVARPGSRPRTPAAAEREEATFVSLARSSALGARPAARAAWRLGRAAWATETACRLSLTFSPASSPAPPGCVSIRLLSCLPLPDLLGRLQRRVDWDRIGDRHRGGPLYYCRGN